jgi:hypothetical protein
VAVQQPVEPGNAIALANLNRAKSIQGSTSRKLIALGIALHSWADTFAHEGFTANLLDPRNARLGYGVENPLKDVPARPFLEFAKIGHSAAGHTPDWPFWNVTKAVEAAISIYRELLSFGATRGFRKGPVRPESYVRFRLDELFGLERASEEARVQMWQKAIRRDFGDTVIYEEEGFYDAVPKVAQDFVRLAEEQREFVLNLELSWWRNGAR